MSTLDWTILISALLFIVIYGVYKTRKSNNMENYLKGGDNIPWWTVGLSIMATQASAITFLSTPGQAYQDGMRFIQFYFGLPLATIILSITFVPIYYKLKVFTAYEFLESRFDLKTRTLAASLFLIQRGLAAGITIYAPAIILSTVMGWSLGLTNVTIGVLVTIYTFVGGTRAVSQTQKQQMVVMLSGMVIAGIMAVQLLPGNVSFNDALHVAGKLDRINPVDFTFDLSERYNFWSGITGALFLFLSYFGTDQSQVQRYLGSKSVSESRLGLLMNGMLKAPMQFMILFVGVTVFIFYQFNAPPVFFNETARSQLEQSAYGNELKVLEENHQNAFEQKRIAIREMLDAEHRNDENGVSSAQQEMKSWQQQMEASRNEVQKLLVKSEVTEETTDTDYVFITFILNHLPEGLVGLLFAMVFSAAMSSTASEINALASTTAIDVYKRSMNTRANDRHYLRASRLLTLMWGGIAIVFATYATLFENLIQLINLLGSIFYGTILGIFMVAFYVKYVKSNAVFIAAVIAEAIVLYIHFYGNLGFLWYNLIGCAAVVLFGIIIQWVINQRN